MNVELRNELNILLEKYNSPEELVQISDFLFEKGLFRYVITPDIFDSLMYNMYRKSLEERNKYLEILEDYINVEIESSYSLQWD
jgi:hypothetical protein